MINEPLMGLLDELTIAHGHPPSAISEIRPKQIAVLARAAVKIDLEHLKD